MTDRTKAATLVLRLVGVSLTAVGLAVSATWLAYAILVASTTALLSPALALTSLVFSGCMMLLVLVSRPLARLITSDLNRPAEACEHCGYPLPASAVCSECGREVPSGDGEDSHLAP